MNKADELIFVVPRESISYSTQLSIQTQGAKNIESWIRENGTFKRRGNVEEDPSWKQVIPYLIFKHKEKYFLMQRTDKADYRLVNLYSLGIGGHIMKQDVKGKAILEWTAREFQEEVSYEGNFTSEPLGIIHEDSNPIGKVHLAYVILLNGNSSQIQIKSEHQSGKLASLAELGEVYQKMENWSKIVYDFLKNKYAQSQTHQIRL